MPMEKTRFAIISDLFKLSKIIGRSLKLAESLASGKVEDEAGHKDISKNIRREMKPVPLLLSGVREYIAEHDDKDFIRAVMRADYSTAYQNCVKGKMRCVITLLSKAYFKDWKKYRTAAARSTGLTAESLAKYNVEKTFISRLRELLPMIR